MKVLRTKPDKYRIVEINDVFYPQIYVNYFIFSRYERISICFSDLLTLDNFDHGFKTLEKAQKRIDEYEKQLNNKDKINYHSYSPNLK